MRRHPHTEELAHAGAHWRTKRRPGGPAHFMAFMGAAAFIALARVFTSFFRRMAFMGAAAFIAFAMTMSGGAEMTEVYTAGASFS